MEPSNPHKCIFILTDKVIWEQAQPSVDGGSFEGRQSNATAKESDFFKGPHIEKYFDFKSITILNTN